MARAFPLFTPARDTPPAGAGGIFVFKRISAGTLGAAVYQDGGEVSRGWMGERPPLIDKLRKRAAPDRE